MGDFRYRKSPLPRLAFIAWRALGPEIRFGNQRRLQNNFFFMISQGFLTFLELY
jgi:hypothetical protein